MTGGADDNFDVFDVFGAPSAASAKADVALLPLVHSFVTTHAPRIVADLRSHGDQSLASRLDAATSAAVSISDGIGLDTLAADVSNAAWDVIKAADRAPLCYKEAFVVAELLSACAADRWSALQHLDRALIMGGPTPVLHDCVGLLDQQKCVPPLAAHRLPDVERSRASEARLPEVVASALSDAGHVLRETRRVVQLHVPSEAAFRPYYDQNTPVVINGLMRSWAAPSRWKDLRWLCAEYGDRIVPVEVGVLSTYMQRGGRDGPGEVPASSSTWHEELMPLQQFIQDYLLPEEEGPAPDRSACPTSAAANSSRPAAIDPRAEAQADSSAAALHKRPRTQGNEGAERQPSDAGGLHASRTPNRRGRPSRVAYLAQHPLFEQLPRLREDFEVPELCSMGRLQHINAWFGSSGTVTPLHFDSYDNLFSQVVGYKYVRLYAPDQTPFLYPTAEGGAGLQAQGNCSAVNIEDPDVERFPKFLQTCYTDVVLAPGQVLFIPAKTWHFVRSLSSSFSISFWF